MTLLLTGVLSTYEALSLGVIRNALASLTQAELIRQPTSEFEFEGTGKHRLVKVANQDKLVQLAAQLGEPLQVKVTLCLLHGVLCPVRFMHAMTTLISGSVIFQEDFPHAKL